MSTVLDETLLGLNVKPEASESGKVDLTLNFFPSATARSDSVPSQSSSASVKTIKQAPKRLLERLKIWLKSHRGEPGLPMPQF